MVGLKFNTTRFNEIFNECECNNIHFKIFQSMKYNGKWLIINLQVLRPLVVTMNIEGRHQSVDIGETYIQTYAVVVTINDQNIEIINNIIDNHDGNTDDLKKRFNKTLRPNIGTDEPSDDLENIKTLNEVYSKDGLMKYADIVFEITAAYQKLIDRYNLDGSETPTAFLLLLRVRCAQLKDDEINKLFDNGYRISIIATEVFGKITKGTNIQNSVRNIIRFHSMSEYGTIPSFQDIYMKELDSLMKIEYEIHESNYKYNQTKIFEYTFRIIAEILHFKVSGYDENYNFFKEVADSSLLLPYAVSNTQHIEIITRCPSHDKMVSKYLYNIFMAPYYDSIIKEYSSLMFYLLNVCSLPI